jgi:hypothetical protein
MPRISRRVSRNEQRRYRGDREVGREGQPSRQKSNMCISLAFSLSRALFLSLYIE